MSTVSGTELCMSRAKVRIIMGKLGTRVQTSTNKEFIAASVSLARFVCTNLECLFLLRNQMFKLFDPTKPSL